MSRSVHDELIFTRKVFMKITEVTRKEFYIAFDPILEGQPKMDFIEKARKYFSSNESVMRILRGERYLWNCLCNSVIIRIVLPQEFGYGNGIEGQSIYDLARKLGADTCNSHVPIKIVMDFESIRQKLPPEYVQSKWRIHMSQLEVMTGDMFISGFGCPDAMFSINPHLKGPDILSVDWVYGGRCHGAYGNQPLVVQCKN